MKYLLIGIIAAVTVINPVLAQIPPAGTYQPQWPTAPYSNPYSYRFVAPTPEDAYRDGTINR